MGRKREDEEEVRRLGKFNVWRDDRELLAGTGTHVDRGGASVREVEWH